MSNAHGRMWKFFPDKEITPEVALENAKKKNEHPGTWYMKPVWPYYTCNIEWIVAIMVSRGVMEAYRGFLGPIKWRLAARKARKRYGLVVRLNNKQWGPAYPYFEVSVEDRVKLEREVSLLLNESSYPIGDNRFYRITSLME